MEDGAYTTFPRSAGAAETAGAVEQALRESDAAGGNGAGGTEAAELQGKGARDTTARGAEVARWVARATSTPLLELGAEADAVRARLHPEGVVTYIVDRNINYTNVCNVYCKFCAFYRPPGSKRGDAYTLTFEQIGAKIDEVKALGGEQILLQGGVNPDLPFPWYLELLRFIKREHPIHVHGFSPVEIAFMAQLAGRDLRETLIALRAAGLDSIPGGGAEILTDATRRRVSPLKQDTAGWLEVMETAHGLGMKTTATMMFGMGESWEERVEHLLRIRDLQARTGGFTAFIAWPFQEKHTALEGRFEPVSADEYLRVVAVARLVLSSSEGLSDSREGLSDSREGLSDSREGLSDSREGLSDSREGLGDSRGGVRDPREGAGAPRDREPGRVPVGHEGWSGAGTVSNFQASWVTMGPKIGQISLRFGCNDMGSTMLEENVVSAAGASFRMDEAEIVRLIHDAGFRAARRRQDYSILQVMPRRAAHAPRQRAAASA